MQMAMKWNLLVCLDRSQGQAMAMAMATYLRQTYLNQKTNDTLMRADIETLSLCLLALLVACCRCCCCCLWCSCCMLPVACHGQKVAHRRTMRKGKRKSAGRVVKLIEMFRGMRCRKGFFNFSISHFFNLSIFDFSIFGQWHSVRLAAFQLSCS